MFWQWETHSVHKCWVLITWTVIGVLNHPNSGWESITHQLNTCGRRLPQVTMLFLQIYWTKLEQITSRNKTQQGFHFCSAAGYISLQEALNLPSKQTKHGSSSFHSAAAQWGWCQPWLVVKSRTLKVNCKDHTACVFNLREYTSMCVTRWVYSPPPFSTKQLC